jgi:hypothetical protein
VDWANERYVRIYTRDTADDQVLSWQARGLWPLLVRKADRAGVIATNHGPRGVAALVQWPREVVEPALAELLADGRIRECSAPAGYVIPNYIEAQETPSSTNQRQRDSRERRRDVANDSVTKRDIESQNATAPSQNVTPGSRGVTRGHAGSHRVTPCRAVPSRTDPDLPSGDLGGAREAPPPKPKRPSRRGVATVMPEAWSPRANERALAAELGVGFEAELAKFVDHHAAKGSRFVDWDAALRTWLRNAVRFGGSTRNGAAPGDTAVDVALRFARGEIT